MFSLQPDHGRAFGILFVCEDNSRRSLIAEALMRDHGLPGIRIFSAGLQPADRADPFTLSTLTLAGIGSDGLWPKDWAGFANPRRQIVDMVVAIGDAAAQRLPKVFPGNPDYLAWRLPESTTAHSGHGGVWGDIRGLRPHVETLVDDLMVMGEVSIANIAASPAE